MLNEIFNENEKEIIGWAYMADMLKHRTLDIDLLNMSPDMQHDFEMKLKSIQDKITRNMIVGSGNTATTYSSHLYDPADIVINDVPKDQVATSPGYVLFDIKKSFHYGASIIGHINPILKALKKKKNDPTAIISYNQLRALQYVIQRVDADVVSLFPVYLPTRHSTLQKFYTSCSQIIATPENEKFMQIIDTVREELDLRIENGSIHDMFDREGIKSQYELELFENVLDYKHNKAALTIVDLCYITNRYYYPHNTYSKSAMEL